MAAIDTAAPEPVDVLIERAGAAVARVVVGLLGGTYGRRVHVIAGKGNNGNDGRAAARRLRARGVHVHEHDAADCPSALPPADLVIDAAYGTGFHGDWEAPDVGSTPVLAVDVPSGIDGLTGVASGRVMVAAATVTFAALKPGLLLGAGPDHGGEVTVADIGLDTSGSRTHVVERADVADWWRPRPRSAHKWSAAVRVVAGSPGMQGAGHLATAAAQRTGAGLVQLMSPTARPSAPVEAVTYSLSAGDWSSDVATGLHRFGAMVIGPGLGRLPATVAAVRRAVRGAGVPVVVDGDGLFALADQSATTGPAEHAPDGETSGADRLTVGSLAERLMARTQPTVLTPHDGEYALLTGRPPGADRITAALRLARETRAVVLLKGPTTVVASSSGAARLVTNGDERLATAGSGDVLAGMIAALLAGGMTAFDAATAGAWLHGSAASHGERLGFVAGDLLNLIPTALADVAP